MHKRRVIDATNVLFFVALICVASFALLEDVSISINEFDAVKRPLLILCGLCIVCQFGFFVNNIRKKEYLGVVLLLLLFMGLVVVSSLLNRTTTYNYSPFAATLNFLLFVIELFAVMIWAAERGLQQFVLNTLVCYVFAIVVVADVITFLDIMSFTDGMFKTNLVGTKFSLSYLHLQLLALVFLSRRRHSRFKLRHVITLLALAFLGVVLTQYLDCNTGSIGSLLLVGLILLFNASPDGWLKRFCSPVTFSIFLLGSAVIAFVIELITTIPIIENIIENVLNRDIGLTGRVEIFNLYLAKVTGNLPFGFGYGSAYTNSMKLFGYANAQNGLLQWILEIGIIPVAIMVILFIVIFRHLSKAEDKRAIAPAIAMIYTFIALGVVEITINMNFFLWMAIIFMMVHHKARS